MEIDNADDIYVSNVFDDSGDSHMKQYLWWQFGGGSFILWALFLAM